MLHERAGALGERMLLITSGAHQNLPWWYPILALLGILIAVLVPFLLELPKKARGLFILSGCLYVLGAVGFEAVGDALLNQAPTEAIGESQVSFIWSYTIEEFLEMMGITIFIYAVTIYLASKNFTLRVGNDNN